MKKFLPTIILIFLISFAVDGQTTVSGGIYANTTWTRLNSPYIADTVVVFPNVTLTIEPGVVVIVNGNLEIRQASLIAEGTITDSITFIGTLPITTWGDTLLSSIVLFNNALSSRLRYCNIKDNTMGNFVSFGIQARMNSSADSLSIQNSYFTNTGTGLGFINGAITIDSCLFEENITAIEQATGTISNSIFRVNETALSNLTSANVQNCIIDSNSTIGIRVSEGGNGSIVANCQIEHNAIGLECNSNFSSFVGNQIHNNIIEANDIGIQIKSYASLDSIYCNRICNNTTYNLKLKTSFNRIAANNYWCTNDSLAIANSIYDGYDNPSSGLLNFMPIDTVNCYLTIGILDFETQLFPFTIYPNPASDYLVVELPENHSKVEINIFNLIGDLESSLTSGREIINIDISHLKNGAYVIQINSEDGISRQKLIKE